MAILTTTIGSYPKPDYLHIPPFVPKHPDPTRRYSQYLATRSVEDDALLERATHENVRHQVEAGIDIPTDGETPRSHYVHYHLRQLGGIDFERLTERVTRGGAWRARFPTIVGKITTGANFLTTDWQRAQAATDKPVKITMPGPMTIIDSTVGAHYGDQEALAADLADALNFEATALAAAGCRHIQIDEPVEEIRARLAGALEHIDAERLIAAPDCGLAMLDRKTVFAKRRNMCAAAQSL